MHFRFHPALGLILCAVCLGGCDPLEAPPGEDLQLGQSEAKQPLPYGPRDDPTTFSPDIETELDKLPMTGASAQAPWPASYWPSYMDSINHRWDGEETSSPATKYGEAFGVSGVEDAVSRMRGIDGQTSRTKCEDDDACKKESGEVCAKRLGKDVGRCVPTWFGICHAWAPASILVPEPKYPVEENGVLFKVNDIKALVTLVHDRTRNRFVSRRCYDDDNGDEDGVVYDDNGRPVARECMDTNPATLHLLVTNYLGLRNQSFVMDRTFDDEVWNQPLISYDITRLEHISPFEANRLIGVETTGGRLTEDSATLTAGDWHHLDPIDVEAGEKIEIHISGSGDGDLYVRWAGQPTRTEHDCRPYKNGSEETCSLTVPEGQKQVFVGVHGYTDAAVDIKVEAGGAPAEHYLFNDDAVKFYDVAMSLRWIGESDAEQDGPLTDQVAHFTRTDRLTYVLEVDADGRPVGGEWTGASKRAHPDFLWLPLEHSQSRVASGKIEAAKVMDLLQRSLGEPEPGEEVKQKTEQREGEVAAKTWEHFGPFKVADAHDLVAELSGTGDADLYVRKGSRPSQHNYDCRPWLSSSNETCEVDGPSDIYVAVHGYSAATFELSLSWGEPLLE